MVETFQMRTALKYASPSEQQEYATMQMRLAKQRAELEGLEMSTKRKRLEMELSVLGSASAAGQDPAGTPGAPAKHSQAPLSQP